MKSALQSPVYAINITPNRDGVEFRQKISQISLKSAQIFTEKEVGFTDNTNSV
ncbi:hypothetical protein C8N42_12823 [Celeribacter persicus]|jgi:hypothetical protein|uniref:Uncharacterized protein n=1 Tax=Celeribacter persicus TaxID=1651082 RepID=A0A2T5H490_9RHOB|nr:hypothetical protein C8N42_12823 [Celeribacter persicus]